MISHASSKEGPHAATYLVRVARYLTKPSRAEIPRASKPWRGKRELREKREGRAEKGLHGSTSSQKRSCWSPTSTGIISQVPTSRRGLDYWLPNSGDTSRLPTRALQAGNARPRPPRAWGPTTLAQGTLRARPARCRTAAKCPSASQRRGSNHMARQDGYAELQPIQPATHLLPASAGRSPRLPPVVPSLHSPLSFGSLVAVAPFKAPVF